MPETVYISSTYEDLKIFRQAAINCVAALAEYYTPLGMEFYDAESVHFVKKCQDDVEACNIYILILGKRYGYIPRGFTKSITELEYEKAAECRRNGKPKEILIFKVGDYCKNYNYEENQSAFVEYQESFLDEVGEILSPKPFDSEAELKFLVSNALMKRLFRQIRNGQRIILPDKDSIMCYCDRKPVITSLQMNMILKKKKIFFLHGDRMTDYPGGIIKRFARYTLGSFNKIEPILSITDLFTSCDPENSNSSVICNILGYINRPLTPESVEIKGFMHDLGFLKSNKIIFPFFYNDCFDRENKKFTDFLCFLNALFEEYSKEQRSYELFVIIIINSASPDYTSIQSQLEPFDHIKTIAANLDKLQPISRDHILDWLETFVTTMEYAPDIYRAYFNSDANALYNMQDVNKTLDRIMTDIEKGDEKLKNLI